MNAPRLRWMPLTLATVTTAPAGIDVMTDTSRRWNGELRATSSTLAHMKTIRFVVGETNEPDTGRG
jgi:hypothetical protein